MPAQFITEAGYFVLGDSRTLRLRSGRREETENLPVSYVILRGAPTARSRRIRIPMTGHQKKNACCKAQQAFNFYSRGTLA